MRDVIVIGAGLAGLVAALRLARAGKSVTLASKGGGGIALSQGTIDLIGYAPERVMRPLEAIDQVPSDHPYATIGSALAADAACWLRDELGDELLVGDPETNMHLPTAVGALRPTALAQPSMVAGELKAGLRYAVVGIRQLKDFSADLVAGNLVRSFAALQRGDFSTAGGEQLTALTIEAVAAWVDLPAREGEADTSGLNYARALDDPAFADRFAEAVARAAGDCDVVLLPAVLGVDRLSVWRQIQERIGRPVAEIPLQPPSVPGIRLNNALLAKVKDAGVRYIPGKKIIGFTAADGALTSVTLDAAGGPRLLEARDIVYAPGGFESGALHVDSRGHISEAVFGLPLTHEDATPLINPTFWGEQPLFEVGVRTDDAGRPVGPDGLVYRNLYVAGGIVAGANRWREKSGDGIALATAVRATDRIVGGQR